MTHTRNRSLLKFASCFQRRTLPHISVNYPISSVTWQVPRVITGFTADTADSGFTAVTGFTEFARFTVDTVETADTAFTGDIGFTADGYSIR